MILPNYFLSKTLDLLQFLLHKFTTFMMLKVNRNSTHYFILHAFLGQKTEILEDKTGKFEN
jgi:hypothetical protein